MTQDQPLAVGCGLGQILGMGERHMTQDPEKPVAWVTERIKCASFGSVGDLEFAEEGEVIHNTEYWSQPFPVYRHPPPPAPQDDQP